jgi:catechol 2,3-dioxygenase-like lactoylglutathione lyase family enzyme
MIAQSLDHFVVPVDDLVAAEDFYSRVFGGCITKRNGLNVRQRKRGAVPHTFIQIGGKRMGVYLQSDLRPAPISPRGLPTYSFTTSSQGLERVSEELKLWGSRFDGPVNNPYPFAGRALFFTDPARNHYCVYSPAVAATPKTNELGITGVGFIELEAPELVRSIDFYQNVLGFTLQRIDEHGNQAMLQMASGQILMLTNAPFSPKGLIMSRTVPGPHIAFYVPTANWKIAMAHLDEVGIAHADRGAAKERKPGQGGTYMDDPAGYVIQFITDGME